MKTVSVVVPVSYNAGSLPLLFAWLGFRPEIIFYRSGPRP